MPELIPLSVLFGNPERESPRISPDGTKLAWLAPSGEVLNVWLAPISAEAGVDWAAARVITDDTDRGIRQFAWAHDGRHLLYLQDIGGDENWRLHDVDLHTMVRRDLTPFDGVQTQIIGLERNRPDEVLLGLNKANPELHDVYRLDLPSGELTKEIDNPGFIAWIPDTELTVRGAVAPLSRASQIRIPPLIAQGANDPRVKQAESEQIVAALKQAGIEYDYMLFSDEGHGFAKPENRLKFYTAADKFLARYLGGRSE
jgi:dipeptidyl aminopeptidase/acylaminoacyl peptidase